MSTHDPIFDDVASSLDSPPSYEEWRTTPRSSRAAMLSLLGMVRERQRLIGEYEATFAKLQAEVRELKEKLGTNSSNSSKPPSSDLGQAKKKKRERGKKRNARKKGGQAGHRGTSRKMVPTEEVDEVLEHKPSVCSECGGEIAVNDSPCGRRQVYELPPVRPVVHEHQIFAGRCCSCGHAELAEYPPEDKHGTLGPRAMAVIATLTGEYHMSKREVATIMQSVYGIPISASTVSATEARVAAALEPHYQEAAEAVAAAPVVNADETTWKSGPARKRAYIWAAVAAWFSFFMVRSSRSASNAKELLGEKFAGVCGSDRYSGYAWLPTAQRQLCWAHIIRDLRKIEERGDDSATVASLLLTWTSDLFAIWHEFVAGEISREEMQVRMNPVQEAWHALLVAGTTCTHPKTQGTCKQLLKYEPALWTFLKHDGVEPTNNAAERAVRPAVLWRKKSFGTDGKAGNEFVERMLTMVTTCKQQGRSPINFLTSAIEAHYRGAPRPSLLPSA